MLSVNVLQASVSRPRLHLQSLLHLPLQLQTVGVLDGLDRCDTTHQSDALFHSRRWEFTPHQTSLLPRPLTGGCGGALLLQQSVSFHQEALRFLLVAPLQLLDHLDVAVLHGGEAVRARDLREHGLTFIQ